MNKFLATALLIAIISMVRPVSGQAMELSNNNYNAIPTVYQDALNEVDDTHTFYAAADLNVRLEPNTDSPIAVTLHRGDTVEFLCAKDGWAMILGADGNYYFVAQDYLTEEKPPMYSDDDYYCLAHVIDAEMGVESWEDKIYTGSVVLNRVHGSDWWSKGSHTVRGVVFRTKPLQYACIKDGNFFREPSAESWRAARYLLENGSQIPSNVVYQAEFKQGKGIWKHTHGAYYCYE